MRKRSVAAGVLTTGYWLAAFAIASVTHSERKFADAWWNVTCLREPGRWFGVKLYDILEAGTGLNYQKLIGWPFLLVLAVTSVAFGFGVWGLMEVVAVWIRRRRCRRLR